jgi:purine-binding chemotaxis protein CheW
MDCAEHLVVARVHDLLLGFDVHDVREVLDDEAILPVPLTPPVVRGLVNLRGEVVTVIDARTLLRCPVRDDAQRPSHLVVQHRRETLSLEVDEVIEVAKVRAAQYGPRPDGMHDAVRSLSEAIVQRERDLLVVIDVSQLFDQVANREGAEERQEAVCVRS